MRRRAVAASRPAAAAPAPALSFLGSSVTTTSFSLPALPAVEGGILSTDFMLGIFHLISASTPNFSGTPAIAPPSGWTSILEIIRSNVLCLYAAWAPGGTPLGGTGWTKQNATSSRALLRVYRNVDLADPIGDFDGIGTSATGNVDVPALTLEGAAGSWVAGLHAVRTAGQPPFIFGANGRRVFDADTAENLGSSDTGAAVTSAPASGAAYAPGGNRILAKIELKRAP
jgi:hypothetical protein